MTRLAMPCLLAMLSVSMAVPGCATAQHVFQPLKECGGKICTEENAARVASDLGEIYAGNAAGEADLLAFAGEEGWPFVTCLVDYYLQNGTSKQKAGAATFKSGHVEARGPTSMLDPYQPAGFEIVASGPTPCGFRMYTRSGLVLDSYFDGTLREGVKKAGGSMDFGEIAACPVADDEGESRCFVAKAGRWVPGPCSQGAGG